jgi:di/tricarboxylate transporter
VQAVDWRTLGLIVAMLGVGAAMENVDLVGEIVRAISPYLIAFSPLFALGVVYLLSSALTEIVTNNAVAVIVTPVAIGLANGLGVDPRPFVVAVMFAASASFLTPIGYQTNTLVYGAGGYKFFDFIRIGGVLNLVCFAITMLLIPIIWPL